MVQSTYPTQPSSSGAPVFEGDHPTPSNFSDPLVAMALESSDWPAPSTLAQKKPA